MQRVGQPSQQFVEKTSPGRRFAPARQVAASLAPAVTTVRAPRFDRMACVRLADRCTAAAARHELTGHLPSAAHRWRKRGWSSTCNMVAAGRCWCLSATDSSITVNLAQANSLDMLALVGEVRRQAGQHNHPHPPARGELPYVILRVGRRVPHLENGLLMIFRLVCGSSAPAPSCWRERRQQTSWAAATPRPLALKPQHSPSPINNHPISSPHR